LSGQVVRLSVRPSVCLYRGPASVILVDLIDCELHVIWPQSGRRRQWCHCIDRERPGSDTRVARLGDMAPIGLLLASLAGALKFGFGRYLAP